MASNDQIAQVINERFEYYYDELRKSIMIKDRKRNEDTFNRMTTRAFSTAMNHLFASSMSNISDKRLTHFFNDNSVKTIQPMEEYLRNCNDTYPDSSEIDRIIEDGIIKLSDNDSKEHAKLYLKMHFVCRVAVHYGSKTDPVLYLVGVQGTRKTQFFIESHPDQFHDLIDSNCSAGDFERRITETICIIDDEAILMSSIGSKMFKNVTSQTKLNIRVQYSAFFDSRQRSAIICGSSNELNILRDTTGNRRISIIEIAAIDIERFKNEISVEKLYANAIQLYKKGWMNQNYLKWEKAVKEDNDKYTDENPRVELFKEYFECSDAFCVNKIFDDKSLAALQAGDVVILNLTDIVNILSFRYAKVFQGGKDRSLDNYLNTNYGHQKSIRIPGNLIINDNQKQFKKGRIYKLTKNIM